MSQFHTKEGEGINLVEYGRTIWRRRRTMAVIVVTVVMISVIYSLIIPNMYKADVVIMPLGGGKGQGLAALTAQFGSLASSLLGGGANKSPSLQLMALLNTRTLAENIIKKHNLISHFLNGNDSDSRESVAHAVQLSAPEKTDDGNTPQVSVGKMEDIVKGMRGLMMFNDDAASGTIIISAIGRDPRFAADLANWHVEELQQLLNKNAFTTAKRNRIFIEGQLAQNKRDLLEAGKGLNEFYKGGKVSNVESKIDVPVDSASGQTSDLERRIPMNATNMNGVLQSELDKLQKRKLEIDAMLGQVEDDKGKTDVVKDVPQQVYLQYLTLRRNLLAQLNTLLAQQYEMAKIEEAKDELAFQIIDTAREPAHRFKPNRRQIVMLSFIASVFIAVFWVFFDEYIKKMRMCPHS